MPVPRDTVAYYGNGASYSSGQGIQSFALRNAAACIKPHACLRMREKWRVLASSIPTA
jgi:hypothetical protein